MATFADPLWRDKAFDLFQKMVHPSNLFTPDISSKHAQWYLRWIATRVRYMSPRLLSPFGLDATSNGQQNFEIAKVLSIFQVIASEMSLNKDTSISQIAECLRHLDKIIVQDVSELQMEQLVFTLIGIFTFLYQPDLHPAQYSTDFSFAAIDNLVSAFPGSTWHLGKRPLSSSAHPLVDLIREFGGPRGPLPNYVASLPQTALSLDHKPITAINVGYYTLRKIVGVSVIWTEDFCQHLEYSPESKQLKLFAAPSFCALLCTDNDGSTFLSRLFCEYYFDDPHDAAHIRARTSVDFFAELLRTFRLLFGQDRDSWTSFAIEYYGNVLRHGWASKAHQDPLIETLCARDWVNVHLYRDIQASNVKKLYYAEMDFPFFGERLLLLQHYAIGESPYSLQTLYRDRRDFRYWGLVAVMLTLVLTFVQAVFSVAQFGTSVAQFGT